MAVAGSLDARVEELCGDLGRIRAPRGTSLNARSWQTEAPLRMLLNNLDAEVAERPEELVVYGGSGKAARNHDALRALVRSLSPRLREDRPLAADIEAVAESIRDGALVAAVEADTAELR